MYTSGSAFCKAMGVFLLTEEGAKAPKWRMTNDHSVSLEGQRAFDFLWGLKLPSLLLGS